MYIDSIKIIGLYLDMALAAMVSLRKAIQLLVGVRVVLPLHTAPVQGNGTLLQEEAGQPDSLSELVGVELPDTLPALPEGPGAKLVAGLRDTEAVLAQKGKPVGLGELVELMPAGQVLIAKLGAWVGQS